MNIMSGLISYPLRQRGLRPAALNLRSSLSARHIQSSSNRLAFPRSSNSRNARPRHSALYSTTSTDSRFSPFFTALLCLGVGAVAYGIYDLYGTLTMWPSELRKDLRDGISARNNGEFETSCRYLYRAWQTSKTLPLASFKSQPLLKTTGIAICLGEVLEQDNQPQAAYEIYAEALEQIHQHTQSGGQVKLTGAEELRAISLAHKLGELSVELDKPTSEQEKYLTEAVERLLKNTTITTSVTTIKSQPTAPAQQGQHQQNASSSSSSPPLSSTGEQYQVTGNKDFLEQPLDGEAHATVVELGLPEWATSVDFAAPLSALAAYYGSHGKPEYAMPLYLHAISVLIPPSPKPSSPADRCRGAQMMNSLAELIMRTTLQPGTSSTTQQQPQAAMATLHQAETWIRKALEVTAAARKSLGPNQTEGDCEIALASSLFNAGLLRELHNDPTQAKKYYSSSLEQFRRIGFKEGIEVNEDAIRRMEGGSPTSA